MFPGGNFAPLTVGSGLPSWVAALSAGQWYEIPSSAPNAVMPVRGIINAWNSLAVDHRTSKIYSVANGGHTDYDGNEVDCFDVERENPIWTQRRASTTTTDTCVAYNAAGDPCSRHSYYGVHLNAFDDRIMLVSGVWACSSGTPQLPTTDSYNITANNYSAAGTHPDVPAALRAPDAVYTVDPNTGDIYGKNVFSTFGRWNRSSNTWTVDLAPSGSAPNAQAAMSACDTTRGRIYIQGGTGSAHNYYDIGSNAWTQPTLTGARAADVASAQRGSMQYVPALDSYIVRLSPAGNDVIKINASTFDAVTLPGLSGGTALQNNDPYTLPANDGAGPYNKFLYVPRLKGCVFVQGFDLNCYFLRLH